MLYVIQKDGKYLGTGGKYLNSSGLIGDESYNPPWFADVDCAVGTSDKGMAEEMAKRYGGEVTVYA